MCLWFVWICVGGLEWYGRKLPVRETLQICGRRWRNCRGHLCTTGTFISFDFIVSCCLCAVFIPIQPCVVSSPFFPLQLACQFPKDEVALVTATALVKTVTNLRQVCLQNQSKKYRFCFGHKHPEKVFCESLQLELTSQKPKPLNSYQHTKLSCSFHFKSQITKNSSYK